MRFAELITAASLGIAALAPLAAQSRGITTLLVVHGKDTVSFEQFARAGDTVRGTWVSNQDGQVQVHNYLLILGAGDLPVRYQMDVRFPDGTGNLPPSEAQYVMEFGADSLTLTTGRTRPVTRRIGMRGGAYPTFGASLVGHEIGLMHLRAAHADSGSIPFTTLGMARASAATLEPARFVGADSAVVGTDRFKVDRAGRILGWRTADGDEAYRARPVDARVFVASRVTADSIAEAAARAAHVVALPAAALERLVGEYPVNATTTVTVARDGDQLAMRVGNQQPSRLLAASSTHFFLRKATSGQAIDFDSDASGNVVLLLPQPGGQVLRVAKVRK